MKEDRLGRVQLYSVCVWHCVLIGLDRALENRESIQDSSPW